MSAHRGWRAALSRGIAPRKVSVLCGGGTVPPRRNTVSNGPCSAILRMQMPRSGSPPPMPPMSPPIPPRLRARKTTTPRELTAG
jgi:hypothetical protein